MFLFVLISQVSRADIRAPSVGYGHCKWRNPVVQAYGTSGDKSHSCCMVQCTCMDCSWYNKSSSLFTPPVIISGYNNQRRSSHWILLEMFNCLLPVWTVSPVAGHVWSGVRVEHRVGSWQTGLVFRLVHRERWEVRCARHWWFDIALSLYIMVTVVFLQQWCACGVQWLEWLSHSAVSRGSQFNCCVSVESSWLWGLDLSI